MPSKDDIGSELKKLHDFGFLMENESISDIRNDLHSSKIWADIFWRRRKIMLLELTLRLIFYLITIQKQYWRLEQHMDVF